MGAVLIASEVVGLILAGGRGSRLGDVDKAFVPLGGRPLLAHTLGRLAPQCKHLVISANGDPARFASFGLPVVADDIAGSGPLAGLVASLDHVARNHPAVTHIVSLPVDTPFAPRDLVPRLREAQADAQAPIVLARSGERVHPAVGLWPVAVRHDMRRALTEDGERGVFRFASRYHWEPVDWPIDPFDPFFNINAPGDLIAAEGLLRTFATGT